MITKDELRAQLDERREHANKQQKEIASLTYQLHVRGQSRDDFRDRYLDMVKQHKKARAECTKLRLHLDIAEARKTLAEIALNEALNQKETHT